MEILKAELESRLIPPLVKLTLSYLAHERSLCQRLGFILAVAETDTYSSRDDAQDPSHEQITLLRPLLFDLFVEEIIIPRWQVTQPRAWLSCRRDTLEIVHVRKTLSTPHYYGENLVDWRKVRY